MADHHYQLKHYYHVHDIQIYVNSFVQFLLSFHNVHCSHRTFLLSKWPLLFIVD